MKLKNDFLLTGKVIVVTGGTGMTTDSRSFLSYSRHEYFRRINNYLFKKI